MGETTVTLEDVWWILCLPIHEDRVIYDLDAGFNAYLEVMEMDHIALVTS